MKHFLLSFLAVLLFSSCSSVKRGQQALNKGNYPEAIQIALENLQKDKLKKSNQEHILILQDAFQKNTDASLRQISFLEKEDELSNSEAIYRIYSNLRQVQNQIEPLLPLYAGSRNKEVKFEFRDYSDLLIQSKIRYTEFLYGESLLRMESRKKESYREAYSLLHRIQSLVPHFRDTDQLIEEAHLSGMDNVLVGIRNETSSVIPKQLEREFLNFSTYGLDDFWVNFHTSPVENTRYDYGVDLHFREINVSPERLLEREIHLEGEVLDSYTYKKDRKGDYVLDSLGNKLRIEHFIKVKGKLVKTVQTKSLAVLAQVDFLNFGNNQLMDSYPIATEFVFENTFAAYEGDPRLLGESDRELLQNRFVPFPTNEQMLKDASGEIKERIKPVLKSRFR